VTPPLAQSDPQWQALDAKIPADHFARDIVRGVAQLDLTPLRDAYAGSGSWAYPPELLLAMILIEMHQGRRSPSQWHVDAQFHVLLQWAGRGIRPARSTWYAFRDRLAPFLDDYNRHVLHAARDADLTTAQDAAQDGSFVEAHASRHRLVNEERLHKRQAALAQAIAADEQGQTPPTPGWMARTGDGRLAQQERYQQTHRRLKKLLEANQQRIPSERKPSPKVVLSPTDPEAALGRDKLKVFRPLYNVQFLTDLESPFILGYEAFSQATDAGTFAPLLDRAAWLTGVALQRVLADASYVTGQELAVGEARNVELFGPWKENDSSDKRPRKSAPQIPKDHFQGLPEEQAYRCPDGRLLNYVGQERRMRSGDRLEILYRYQCASEHCRACALRPQCTPNAQRGRSVRRSEHEDLIERHKARMAETSAKAFYKKRCCTVERSFADAKQHRSFRRVTTRGLRRVRAELALTVLTHNVITYHQLMTTQDPPPENHPPPLG
jgi:transposase